MVTCPSSANHDKRPPCPGCTSSMHGCLTCMTAIGVHMQELALWSGGNAHELNCTLGELVLRELWQLCWGQP
eukprot:15449378-Alexandrium_andersonii.AAC.1